MLAWENFRDVHKMDVNDVRLILTEVLVLTMVSVLTVVSDLTAVSILTVVS